MNARWTIRLGALVFALGLIGSSAFAARLDAGVGGRDRQEMCAGSCQRTAIDAEYDPYPAYQPLEVCDDVCIFY